jgi:DNA polymerase I-like protein with 3'-5' exonuclease and polymerase domains
MRHWQGLQGADYYCVQTMEQFWRFYEELRVQHSMAIDTETSGFDWVRAHACGLVFGWGIENNYYLPIAHQETTEPQLDLEQIREPLSEVLSNDKLVSVFWNAKFDLHFLRKAGLEVNGIIHDGVVLSHLIDENQDKSLKSVATREISRAAGKWETALVQWRVAEAKRRRSEFSALLTGRLKNERAELEAAYFKNRPFLRFSGLTKRQITAALKKWLKEQLQDHPLAKNKKDQITYDYVPLDIMVPYACADVHYTHLLYKDLLLKVAGHETLRKLYINEMQLADLLFEVESGGVKVDKPYLERIAPEYEKDIANLRAEIMTDVGFEFDLNSNPQLIAALIKAGCRMGKLTKKGQELASAGERIDPTKHYSVDNETLERLAMTHPFAAKIQEYRKKMKLLNTYIIKIAHLVDENHYLHTTFNANVSTGRMSSREPNCQNIPNRETAIRKAFTLPERIGFEGEAEEQDSEWVFAFFDYSQVELRLTAHHSQDPTFLAAYPWDAPSKDVHSITCAEAVMGMSLDDYLKVYNDDNHPMQKEYKWFRNIAKRVNFGIIYGAGAGAIQRQVSTPQRIVSKDECEEYIQRYFQKYPGVKQWIDVTHLCLRRDQYLRNSFGRYRRLPDAKARDKWKRERAGRQGVNFLIQGDAADLFKTATVRVRNLLAKEKARTRIVNFVHDEIQFYVHKSEFYLLPLIKSAMEDFQFSVPIIVDIETSRRDWAAKKELKVAA